MKCVSSGCKATVDETRPTEMIEVEGKLVVNPAASRALAAELAKWEHVAVVVTRGGATTVLSGHTCPAHAASADNVSLTVGGK